MPVELLEQSLDGSIAEEESGQAQLLKCNIAQTANTLSEPGSTAMDARSCPRRSQTGLAASGVRGWLQLTAPTSVTRAKTDQAKSQLQPEPIRSTYLPREELGTGGWTSSSKQPSARPFSANQQDGLTQDRTRSSTAEGPVRRLPKSVSRRLRRSSRFWAPGNSGTRPKQATRWSTLRNRAPGTGHRAPGTGHRAPGTGHRAPGTGHRAPGDCGRGRTNYASFLHPARDSPTIGMGIDQLPAAALSRTQDDQTSRFNAARGASSGPSAWPPMIGGSCFT